MNIIQYIFFLALIYLILRNEDKLYTIKNKEKCRTCGEEIDSTFLYCPYCKEEIKRNCDACGKLIYADWRYCPFCYEEDKDKGYIIGMSKIVGGKK